VNVITGSVSGTLAGGVLEVSLTLPSQDGWAYLKLPDPGEGLYPILEIRRPDGSVIPAENVWQTDRTFIGNGRRPVLEDNLHLVDQNVGGTYTIVYAPPSIPPTLVPPVILGCGDPIPTADSAIASLSNTLANLCESVVITAADNPGGPGCAGVDNTERVFTITTDCAGTLLTTQIIATIDDAIPLILTTPADQDLGCAPVPAPDTYLGDLSVTGGCAALSISVVDSAPVTNGCDVLVVRTYVVASDCGQGANSAQILRRQAPPAAPVCPADITVELGQAVPPADPGALQLDACASYTVAVTTNAFIDRVEYTYTVTNACGDEVACSQTIFTSDTTPPVVTAPADTDAGCDGLPAADAFLDQLVIDDDCTVLATQVVDNVVASSGCVVTVERVYSVSNACGLTASATQTITYTVITPPDLVALCPPDLTVACGDPIPPAAAFTQDCVSVFVIETDGTPTCAGIEFERVYLFTTDCGEQSSCTQTITQVDTTPPFLASAPLNAIYCIPEYPPAEAFFSLLSATEDCPGSMVTTNVTDSPATNNGCDISFRRTYTFENSCGLTNSASHNVRYINVDSAPVDQLECPADITLECGEPVPDFGTNTPYACGEFRIQFKEVPGGCAGMDDLLFVREVVGFCGGTVSACFQRVSFRDTTPPVFSGVPAPNDLGCNPAVIPEPAIPASLVASDICSTNPTVAIGSVDLQTNGCRVVRTISIHATDSCLNRSTAEIVTSWSIADTMIPADVCVPDRVLPCAPATAATPELNQFLDNLQGLCISSSGVTTTTADGCGAGSIIEHVYTAVLECGGIVTCTQRIDTTDDQVPVVTAPADLDLGCNPTTIPTIATLDASGFTATNLGCSAIASTELSSSILTNNGARALLVVYTAVNECGGTASATQMIVWTVSDTGVGILPIAPVDLGCNPDVIPQPDPSVVMPAGLQVTVGAINQSTNDCSVTRLVEYLVTDACNNAGSVTQTLTWSEAGAAAFVDLSGAMDETAVCTAGPVPELSATDGCGTTAVVPAPTVETLPGGTACVRSERRVWTFIGACGATISHTQTVTITADAPVFANVPADLALGCRETIPGVSPPVTASACGLDLAVTFSAMEVPLEKGLNLRCGDYVRSWSTTGPCGAIVSATQVITIVEHIAPVLTIPGDADLGCNPDVLPVADPALASATDNCFLDGIDAESRTFTNGNLRVFEAVYTATDACGNQSVATQTVTYAVGNCEPPPDAVASLVFESCADGIQVNILNPKPGSTYTATLQDQSLDGIRVTFPTPPNGNQAVNVVENPGGRVVAVTPSGFTVDCAPPTATAAFDCDTGLITVTITGGEADNGFRLALAPPFDDVPMASGTIAAGATTQVTFPITGDGTYGISGFEDNNGASIAIVPNELVIDCPDPVEAKATAAFNCADGLVVNINGAQPGATYITTFNGLTAVGTRVTFPDPPPNGNQAINVIENPGGRVVTVTPASITVNCTAPTATAAFDCDTGLITVTISGGETDNGFQVGITNPDNDMAVQSGTIAAGATTNLTFPISADGTYALAGFEDNNGAVLAIVPGTLNIDCPGPVEAEANAMFSCAEGLVVSIMGAQPGATYTTTFNGQSADGTRVTFPTSPNGNQAVNVIENPGGRVVTVTPNGIAVNCAPPTATAAFDCDTGLITVTVKGGETENGFEIGIGYPNDDIAVQSGTIAAGATTNLTFPISIDGSYSLTGFEDNNGAALTIEPSTLAIDCPEPVEAKAAAVFSCAEGLVVSIMSPRPGATYTTTFNGQSVDGTRANFPAPPNGNQAVNVIENPGGRVVAVTPNGIVVDCAPPTATAAFDCDSGLITVTITGGETANGFNLALDLPFDDIVTASGNIAAGATTNITFPISGDGNYGLRGFETNNGATLMIVPNAFFIDCPEPPPGAVQLEKTVYRGHDNGLGCPGQDTLRVRPRGDITYCFTVSNTGQAPLTQIMVVDQDLAPAFMGEVRDLAPGEQATLFFETVVSKDVTNRATVNALVADVAGDPLPGIAPVTDEDTAMVDTFRFDLALLQSVLTRGPFAVGRNIRFRIRVLNQGDIPARNIELVNDIPRGFRLADPDWTLIGPRRARYNFPLPRGLARGVGSDLNPGEELEVTINFVIEEEASGLPITNVVEIAAATDELGQVIPDVDSTAGGGLETEDDIAPVEVDILPPSVSLGERVWVDSNFNGIQDPGEPGVADVVVDALAASNGMVFGSATTDVDGAFIFLGLPMGNYALQYNLRSLPDGFVPTAYDTGRTPNTGLLMPGEAKLDLGLAVWQPASAAGLVWFDLDGDGLADFENATNLGIANVSVRLYEVVADGERVLLEMVPSAARGGFEFDGLLPGTYEIEADTPADPPDLVPSTAPTTRFTVGFGDRVENINIGFTPRPTAIGLESFAAERTADGVTITWKTAWEDNTLGFFLHRVDRDGNTTRINDALVLARGGDTYQLTDPGVPGGRYWLEEIDNDLTSTVQEEEAIARVAAAPLGTPTETLQTTSDALRIEATSARSYLVSGFSTAPRVIDTTNPDFPLQLIGEHLENDAGHAAYFSPAAGRTIIIVP